MIKRLALIALLGCAALGSCATEEAGNRPAAAQRLNPEQVPEDLRHLVPLAEKWGIGDDDDRNTKVEGSTPAEREELRAAVTPLDSRIDAWLNSFGKELMPDEAAAFMYMLIAIEEMPTDGTR